MFPMYHGDSPIYYTYKFRVVLKIFPDNSLRCIKNNRRGSQLRRSLLFFITNSFTIIAIVEKLKIQKIT